MQWSRLRAALEARFAPSLRDRLTIHQARYRHANEEVGRVWLQLDGEELASFATGARWRRVRIEADRLVDEQEERGARVAYESAVGEAAERMRAAGARGDDALDELEAALSLPVEEALASSSPLLQALAVADGRVGKRRLRALLADAPESPLVRALLEARRDAEDIRPYASRAPGTDDRERDAAGEPPHPFGASGTSVGTVKWWNDAKGYGAIACADTAPWDVWSHFSAIQAPGFKTVREGERVLVNWMRRDQESFRYLADHVWSLDTDVGADRSGP